MNKIMNKFSIMLLAAATGTAFTSCATVFCGSRAKVTFDANVPTESATLTITDTEVKAEAPGYEPVRFTIYKNFNAVSVINLLEILGWGIDAATGAMMKPDQRSYEIMFTKPVTEKAKAE